MSDRGFFKSESKLRTEAESTDNMVNVSPASMKVRPLLEPEDQKLMW